MIRLFNVGYRLAFSPNIFQKYFLSLLLSAFLDFLVQMMIMIPACIANEEVKHVVQILPCWIPKNDIDLKLEFEKVFRKQKYLTVWNIYFFDRSLVITGFGTLLTYGILIGTVGKVFKLRWINRSYAFCSSKDSARYYISARCRVPWADGSFYYGPWGHGGLQSSARPSPRVRSPTENHEPAQYFQRDKRFMVKEESTASVGTRFWTPEGRSLTLSIAFML
ncbi:hypothetical protein AVEN_269532-1 [Araneus ventricosus]|uniref:Uncharacterized protein n=1 Tax=Araneus ventricosus TaxID=182803 RepID=A0A4Y2CCB6_ARAVE|nr:hypothetical protein AVEN_269532-1 [Araneus ventricosus]